MTFPWWYTTCYLCLDWTKNHWRKKTARAHTLQIKQKEIVFILPAVFIFTQKKNWVVLVKKQKIIEDKNKSACIFVRNKKLFRDKTAYYKQL